MYNLLEIKNRLIFVFMHEISDNHVSGHFRLPLPNEAKAVERTNRLKIIGGIMVVKC